VLVDDLVGSERVFDLHLSRVCVVVPVIRMRPGRGMKATFVDMTTACADARLHAPDDSDGCDGCATHPGIEGHRGMYEDAWPVMSKTMGWTADRGVGSKPGTATYFSRGQ
jgi:hypothetical protein